MLEYFEFNKEFSLNIVKTGMIDIKILWGNGEKGATAGEYRNINHEVMEWQKMAKAISQAPSFSHAPILYCSFKLFVDILLTLTLNLRGRNGLEQILICILI